MTSSKIYRGRAIITSSWFETTLGGRSQTTFTRFGFFWPPTPLRLHFPWYKSLQKVDFFYHLSPSSCNLICERHLDYRPQFFRWALVKGGQNLPPLVEIGLTDLPNIKGATGYQALYKLSIFWNWYTVEHVVHCMLIEIAHFRTYMR